MYLELHISQHLPGDQPEIFFGDLQGPKAEGRAPMDLVFDERQPVNQRQDRSLARGEKAHIPPEWDKPVAHVILVNPVIGYLADGGKRLAFLRFCKFQFGRIVNHPVIGFHAFQRFGFAMVGLDKASS